jgi:hypothetical protein
LGPHRLGVFLNSVEMPIVARELVRRLGVPYSTMEWDLLDVAVDELGLSSLLHRRSIADVAALRAGAAERGVASEGMQRLYREQWGLDSVVLRQAAESPAGPRRARGDGPFVIAVCGNVYAVEEFSCLLAALDRLGWAVAGRALELVVIGVVDPAVGPVPAQVRVTGWVGYEESLRALGEADLGYCPYWFAAERRRAVATSFPSKLISYLTCGVPVFYHGPEAGTPAAFLSRYPAGVTCHSLDPAVVAASIGDLVASPGKLLSAQKAADAVIAGELSAHTLQRRLGRWLEDTEDVS